MASASTLQRSVAMSFRLLGSPVLLSTLMAYTVLAGIVAVAQSERRRREARVQRWNDVFRGVIR
jgi:hypothetical protein